MMCDSHMDNMECVLQVYFHHSHIYREICINEVRCVEIPHMRLEVHQRNNLGNANVVYFMEYN